MAQTADPASPFISGDASTILSSQRTAMSFERTAQGNDRTLMAAVRTALALIGFGFTIFQFFHKLSDQFVRGGLPPRAPLRFGLALIIYGVVLLAFGIYNHRQASAERRRRREALFEAGLIHRAEPRQFNSAMIIAVLLLILGLLAILRVGLSTGPL